LKLENILVKWEDLEKKKPNLKIGDFGLAIKYNSLAPPSDKCGSFEYTAPEVFTEKYHGFEVDYWALGVILFYMLSGYMPFSADNDGKLIKSIIRT